MTIEEQSLLTTDVYLEPLTIETIRDKWSKTYNPIGKPDWSHIFPYYHSDILFQDSIQRIQGYDPFIKMCNRLTKRCRSLRMDISHIA